MLGHNRIFLTEKKENLLFHTKQIENSWFRQWIKMVFPVCDFGKTSTGQFSRIAMQQIWAWLPCFKKYSRTRGFPLQKEAKSWYRAILMSWLAGFNHHWRTVIACAESYHFLFFYFKDREPQMCNKGFCDRRIDANITWSSLSALKTRLHEEGPGVNEMEPSAVLGQRQLWQLARHISKTTDLPLTAKCGSQRMQTGFKTPRLQHIQKWSSDCQKCPISISHHGCSHHARHSARWHDTFVPWPCSDSSAHVLAGGHLPPKFLFSSTPTLQMQLPL